MIKSENNHFDHSILGNIGSGLYDFAEYNAFGRIRKQVKELANTL